MSASIRPTERPCMWRAIARFAATVDLPTPPLPLATAITCFTPGSDNFCGICGFMVYLLASGGRKPPVVNRLVVLWRTGGLRPPLAFAQLAKERERVDAGEVDAA